MTNEQHVCPSEHCTDHTDAPAIRHRLGEARQLCTKALVYVQAGHNPTLYDMLDELRTVLADLAVKMAETDLDDEPEGEPVGRSLPIMLGGATLRCCRCTRPFTAQTWRCVDDYGKHGDAHYHGDVCRRCADADPELRHWSGFCDIADVIDAVMQTAPDKKTRELLAMQIRNAAEHFAAWRWPDEEEE